MGDIEYSKGCQHQTNGTNATFHLKLSKKPTLVMDIEGEW